MTVSTPNTATGIHTMALDLGTIATSTRPRQLTLHHSFNMLGDFLIKAPEGDPVCELRTTWMTTRLELDKHSPIGADVFVVDRRSARVEIYRAFADQALKLAASLVGGTPGLALDFPPPTIPEGGVERDFFTPPLTIFGRQAITAGTETARRSESWCLDPLHLLHGLLSDDKFNVTTVLRELEIDPSDVRKKVTAKIEADLEVDKASSSEDTVKKTTANIEWSPKVKHAIFDFAHPKANQLEYTYTGTEHLLYGIAACDSREVSQILTPFNLTSERISNAII